jgi:hypothetical protein
MTVDVSSSDADNAAVVDHTDAASLTAWAFRERLASLSSGDQGSRTASADRDVSSASRKKRRSSRFLGEFIMTGMLLDNSDGTPYFDAHSTSIGISPGPSAAASALMSIMTFLNDSSLQWRVQTEFNTLKPQLDSSISDWATNGGAICYDNSAVGCIVQLVISSWDGPISTSPVFSFVGIYACSCGLDYQSALNDTLRQGSIVPSGPDGGVLTFIYIWYKQE